MRYAEEQSWLADLEQAEQELKERWRSQCQPPCREDGLLIRQTCGWGQLGFEVVRL